MNSQFHEIAIRRLAQDATQAALADRSCSQSNNMRRARRILGALAIVAGELETDAAAQGTN